MRKWIGLSIVTAIFLAACSRTHDASTSVQAASAASTATPAVPNPEPVSRDSGTPEPLAPPTPEPAREPAIAIPSGTRLHVRLDETVDTRRNRVGDVVHATLSRPVVVGGRTLIPAGTRFSGRVTTSDASGRLKGRAHIGVALHSFQLHGRTYQVATTGVERASQSHKKRNAIAIGGGTGLGAALGAVAGGGAGALIGAGAGAAAGTVGAAATGKLHVSIPAEAPLMFTLRAPVGM